MRCVVCLLSHPDEFGAVHSTAMISHASAAKNYACDMANNVILRPDDILYVQPNPFAKLGLAIETVLFPLSAATNALGDYRELVGDLRWIDRGQPLDQGGGDSTIRVTASPGGS